MGGSPLEMLRQSDGCSLFRLRRSVKTPEPAGGCQASGQLACRIDRLCRYSEYRRRKVVRPIATQRMLARHSTQWLARIHREAPLLSVSRYAKAPINGAFSVLDGADGETRTHHTPTARPGGLDLCEWVRVRERESVPSLFPVRTSKGAQHRRRRHSTRIYFEAKEKGNFGNFDDWKRLKPCVFNGLCISKKGNKSVIRRLGNYPKHWSEIGKRKAFKISNL